VILFSPREIEGHLPLPETPCEFCNNTGMIQLDELMKCAACEGTGKIYGNPCVACQGTGQQQIVVSVVCPKCEGEGK
jgi:DnaJ-class molecular chaperone